MTTLKMSLGPNFFFSNLGQDWFWWRWWWDDDPKMRHSRFILYINVQELFFNFHVVWMSSCWILIHLCPISKIKKIALVIENGQKFFVMWVDMYSILFLCTSSWLLPWVHIYHVMFHKWQIHMLPNQHPLRLHLHHWNKKDIMLECIVVWTMKLLNLVLACILKHVLKWNGLALKSIFHIPPLLLRL